MAEQKIITPETQDPWQPFTLADAYADRPPIQYVVQGIFALPSLNIVYGPPGCLKSFVMADLALCVASGHEWLQPAPWQPAAAPGIKTNTGAVMWLDFDMGSMRTHERLGALGKAHGAPPNAPLFYYSMPSPWLDANKPESIGFLILRAQKLETKLIVIDNLGTVSGGVDENSGAMIAVMSLLRQLAESTSAAVVLIHHQRKSNGINGRAGDSLRGHSSIEAALDLALQVERDAELLTIKSTKTRGVDVAPISAAFTYTHKDDESLESAKFFGLIVEDATSNAAIAAEIKTALTGAVMNKRQLTEAVKATMPDIGLNRIRNSIERLASDGAIRTRPGSRNEMLYSL